MVNDFRSRRFDWLYALLVTFAATVPAVAEAQESDDSKSRAPVGATLTPPKLSTFVEAEYPQQAAAEGLTAAVELELTVGIDGKVETARVVTGAGHGFDEAAVAAAQKFAFEPATKNGKPIAAKIRYRYVFELKVAAPKPAGKPAEPAKGALEGRILNREGGQAISNAEVIVTTEGAAAKRALTTTGTFAFRDLPPGSYRVSIRAKGFEPVEQVEEVRSGEAAEVTYRLTPQQDPDSFTAVARIDPPPREVTRRTIGSQELTRIPGTRGDALRAVELLPGVGRPPFGLGLLIVRGSAPGDSQVFFEGVPVPLLYHFGGLTSFVNSRALDRIDFYPGNFSVRYGRKIGGILEVEGKDPAADGRFHGVADLNIIDSSLLVEAPLGKRGGLLFAGRRSYIDFFFQNVVPSDTFSTVAAPVYYDYQALGAYRLTSRDKLRLSIYGSSDKLKLFFKRPSDSDPIVRGNLDVSTQFHRIQALWRRRLSEDVDQDVQLAFGRNDLVFGIGDTQRFEGTFYQLQGRAEWRARLSSRVRVIGGMDIQLVPTTIDYVGVRPRQQEGDPGGNGGPISTDQNIETHLNVTAYRPAAYVESNIRPIDPLLIIMGLRLDWYREVRSWSFDPRLAARYQLTPDTALKAGVGVFSQPPEFQESAPAVGNPNLKPLHAVHTSVGVDHKVSDVVSFGVEGFYKRLYNRVVNTNGGVYPYFENDGVGNIFGLEVSGRAQPKGRFFGYLSYTLMRSERKDRGGPTRLFDFDQTHIFTLAAVYRLGRGWELGGTFRLVSGNPYTPVVGSVYNANSDLYQPIYGAVNSSRNPMFNRLDVRLEKQWRFTYWKLAAYLDVQNVYNAANREGVNYSYNYQQSSNVTGLPIIPSIGLRGEL